MTETMFCDRKLLHPTFHFGMQNHFKGKMLVFVSLPFMTSRIAFEINSQRGPAVVHPPPPPSLQSSLGNITQRGRINAWGLSNPYL